MAYVCSIPSRITGIDPEAVSILFSIYPSLSFTLVPRLNLYESDAVDIDLSDPVRVFDHDLEFIK